MSESADAAALEETQVVSKEPEVSVEKNMEAETVSEVADAVVTETPVQADERTPESENIEANTDSAVLPAAENVTEDVKELDATIAVPNEANEGGAEASATTNVQTEETAPIANDNDEATQNEEPQPAEEEVPVQPEDVPAAPEEQERPSTVHDEARPYSEGGEVDMNRVSVEFVLLPEGVLHSAVYTPDTLVRQLKDDLSAQFNVEIAFINMAVDGVDCQNDDRLEAYRGENSFDNSIRIEVSFETEKKSSYVMPDVIEVHLEPEENEYEQQADVVYVKIERENLKHDKPYLGGFRNKRDGTIYHHASSQTNRKKRKEKAQKFHRETQTIDVATRSQQTTRESGTQMDRKDLYTDHSRDTVIVARPYFTADQLEAVRQHKANEIQCFLRQCFAWRRVRRLRDEKRAIVEQEQSQQEQKKAADDLEHQKQIQRRMHPRTATDFQVLHAELEAWRLHETARIKGGSLSDEDKQEELKKLLAKEVKLLQTIDRLKVTASKENKFQKTKETLEKMSSPKEWFSREGDVVEVETPFTTRARELVELYSGLCLNDLSKEERIDVLLHVKYTVDEFDCELTRDMIHLIQREEDLLRRGRPDKSMTGLRKRLANLFLQFIETPEFNPEAATFQRVPFVEVNTQKMPYIRRILNNKEVTVKPPPVDYSEQYE